MRKPQNVKKCAAPDHLEDPVAAPRGKTEGDHREQQAHDEPHREVGRGERRQLIDVDGEVHGPLLALGTPARPEPVPHGSEPTRGSAEGAPVRRITSRWRVVTQVTRHPDG